jgi:tetratricopeptide (TPR) repeat protein
MELNLATDNIQRSTFLNLSNDYCITGTYLADAGNLKAALEIFNKAIETNPNNHIAYFNRATIKIDLGDLEGAKKDFNRFDLITK